MIVTKQQYDKRVNLLAQLEIGELVVVNLIAPTNPTLFVEVVKIAIDLGEPYEFNKDYTKVKRLDNRIYEPINN